MPTRIFLDTEFTGLHQQAALISVGLAAENGDVFYAELNDYDPEQVSPWVKENVIPLLSGPVLRAARNAPRHNDMFLYGDQPDVSRALRNWLARFGGPDSVHIWADVPAWDWVLFCELFGGAFGLPQQVHYIARDLATALEWHGTDPDTDREKLGGPVVFTHPKLRLGKHHALYDALLEKAVYENLLKKMV